MDDNNEDFFRRMYEEGIGQPKEPTPEDHMRYLVARRGAAMGLANTAARGSIRATIGLLGN